MFQELDVSALKLVMHQLVMRWANTDNKKLHSSHTFVKIFLCSPLWSHWTAAHIMPGTINASQSSGFLSIIVQNLQEGKWNCFMFITAALLWTQQRSLYAALTEMLFHSPLINAVQASVEQNSCLSLKQTRPRRGNVLVLADWPILTNRCANQLPCQECPGRASNSTSFEVNLIRFQS